MQNQKERGKPWSFARAMRRVVPAAVFVAAMTMSAGLSPVFGAGGPAVEHPIMQPAKFTEQAICENCGMNRNMWARTRHSFTNGEGKQHTCSLHCAADLSAKAGDRPTEVAVALYLSPETEIPAAKAVYVVGSKAPGTMTANSKLAFADVAAAEAFIKENGGEPMNFDEAFSVATDELPAARQLIAEKRLKTEKVRIPGDTVSCGVCGMMPAKFPAHRAQILTTDKETIHFCSTSCLSKFVAAPEQYKKPAPKIMNTWVTVYPDGGYDYAGGLYYVVGSGVMGSMGPEALPFRNRADAGRFAADNGGVVTRFSEVTPARISGKVMKNH